MGGDEREQRRRTTELARTSPPRRVTDESAPPVAAEIAASWSRCAATVDPDRPAAPVDDDPTEIRDRWAASPIRRSEVRPDVQLSDVALQSGLVAAISDEQGRLLWTSASRQMRDIGERVGFVPGGHWDERSVGTNAVGLSLHTGRPETVFSSEHWSDCVQDWVCWSAPIRTPDGSLLGVIDLSGRWDHDSPLARMAVTTLGRLVEAHLPDDVASHGALTEGLALRLLGPPEARLDGLPLNLSPRQLEIAAVLSLHGPATLDVLHDLVYGARLVTPATLKAELSHLRRLLGGAVASRPYRLTLPVRTDVAVLQDALRHGDLTVATEAYRGPLLPDSEAPFVVDLRHVLDATLRNLLLASTDPVALLRFATLHPYDHALLERVLEVAPVASPEHAEAAARLEVGGRDDPAW